MLWSFKTCTGTSYSCLWDKTNSGQGNACQNPRSLHGHWWAKDSSFSSCITCPRTKIAVCIIITEQAQCQETTNLMMWQWLNSTHTQLSLRKTNSLFFKCMKIRSRYKISQLFTDASIGMIDEISIMKVCRCSQKRNALFIKMRKNCWFGHNCKSTWDWPLVFINAQFIHL